MTLFYAHVEKKAQNIVICLRKYLGYITRAEAFLQNMKVTLEM